MKVPVQEQYELKDGSELRLTVARYYTPSGRCIQRSYEKGSDEYYNEIYERLKRGEFVQDPRNYGWPHFVDRCLSDSASQYALPSKGDSTSNVAASWFGVVRRDLLYTDHCVDWQLAQVVLTNPGKCHRLD